MKHAFLMLVWLGVLLLGGCASGGEAPAEPQSLVETAAPKEAATDPTLDGSVYLGQYLDADIHEPNLEIAEGADGGYTVKIGIYRLTMLEDGVGELMAEGMRFTATDAAGNPIGGVITVDGQTATVTFTDSTWEYLKNGDAFLYTRSSDT